jgi:hypothetical protein
LEGRNLRGGRCAPAVRAYRIGKRLFGKSVPPPDHFFVHRDRASQAGLSSARNPLMMPSIFRTTGVRSQFVKKKLASEAHLVVDESLATVAPYVG